MMKTTKYGTYTFLRDDRDLRTNIVNLAMSEYCDNLNEISDYFYEKEDFTTASKTAALRFTATKFNLKNAVYNNKTSQFIDFEIEGRSTIAFLVSFEDNGEKYRIHAYGYLSRFTLEDIMNFIEECNKSYYDYEDIIKILDREYAGKELDEEEQEIFNVFKELL